MPGGRRGNARKGWKLIKRRWVRRIWTPAANSKLFLHIKRTGTVWMYFKICCLTWERFWLPGATSGSLGFSFYFIHTSESMMLLPLWCVGIFSIYIFNCSDRIRKPYLLPNSKQFLRTTFIVNLNNSKLYEIYILPQGYLIMQ